MIVPKRIWIPLGIAAFFLIPALFVLTLGPPALPPRSVVFSQSANDLDAYDFLEIAARVYSPRAYFIWQGTGEHYFFNGTTAYWPMGSKGESVIRSAIERLHRLKINRMRVTIAGRTNLFYGEPVMAGPAWSPFLRLWLQNRGVRLLHLAGAFGQRYGMGLGDGVFTALGELNQPDDIYHPDFDYSRFQVAYSQTFERALRFARADESTRPERNS